MKPLLLLLICFSSMKAGVRSATPTLLDFKELEKASLVVVAEVVSFEKMGRQKDEQAFEHYLATLKPLSVVKGEHPGESIPLELRIGGYVGFDQKLSVKERYVFFLRKTSAGAMQLVHSSAIAKF